MLMYIIAYQGNSEDPLASNQWLPNVGPPDAVATSPGDGDLVREMQKAVRMAGTTQHQTS